MLSVELDGAVELRDAMTRFTPDLANNMDNEIRDALTPIVRKARGFVPTQAPLKNWNIYSRERKGKFPWFNSLEIRAGIFYTTESPARNKRGFSYAASIVNSTPAGSIVETAGRKNPNGRKQNPIVPYAVKTGAYSQEFGGYRRDTNKKLSSSPNPNAGRQFISALGPLYKVARQKGQSGRVSKKFNGRLIFRAWGQDQGRANGAVLTSIDKTIRAFHARTGNKHKTIRRAA